MTLFARERHTPASPYSYYGGTEEALCRLVEAHWATAEPGRAKDSLLIKVPAEGFFSGVVKVDETTELKAVFEARAKGEAPYLQFRAIGGEKLPARSVAIILYTKEAAGTYADPDGPEWQIASINASAEEGAEPPHPMSMARNMAGLAGGSTARYSAEELVAAILYWSDKAMRG